MESLILNIKSEIGKLRAVMLHRPGREIENLVPEYLGKLLFDDIPYLKIAQQEHDAFADLLRKRGARVLYIEDMAADVLRDERLKFDFVDRFLRESGIDDERLFAILKDYLLQMEPRRMVDAMIAGIRKQDVPEAKFVGAQSGDDDYQFYVDPMPNLYFTRDIGAVIGEGISISRMKTEARKRETLFLQYVYRYHPMLKDIGAAVWYDRSMPYSIEGGDELVLSDEVVAIGSSERTSRQAIEIEARNLFASGAFKRVIVFDIPKCRAFMHLDTVFTMVDRDKFTIHPGIEEPMNLYIITPDGEGGLDISSQSSTLEDVLKSQLHLSEVDLIRCGGGDPIAAAREQWNDGSNTFAIAPGVVITYERNYVSNELLTKHGVKVLAIASSEISRGRGGPRCMSMPLVREDL